MKEHMSSEEYYIHKTRDDIDRLRTKTNLLWLTVIIFLFCICIHLSVLEDKLNTALNKEPEIVTVEVPVEKEPTPINITISQPIIEREVDEWESLGYFKLTAYCPCEKCCGKNTGITATGTKAAANRTIAVDPKLIPYGTIVKINDIEYVAEDCGGKVESNHIDIFFETHEEAEAFGCQYLEVFKKKG